MLYSPDTTVKISAEAAKPDSAFSLNDRIGLVIDSVALAKAGFSNTSSMFTLIDGLRGETECTTFLIRPRWIVDKEMQQTWFGAAFLTVSPT